MTKEDYAKELRQRLVTANVDQLPATSLGYKCGVSHHTMIEMYAGECTNPDYNVVYKTAKALDVSPIWLLSGAEAKPQDCRVYKRGLKTIWRRLLNLAAKHKLNTTQFAEKIGVSKATTSRWFTATKTPSIESLLLITQEFNVSLSDLLFGRKS